MFESPPNKTGGLCKSKFDQINALIYAYTMEDKESIVLNIKKTQSVLSMIIKREQKDSDPMMTMQQMMAAIGLLRSANQMILSRYMKKLVHEASGKDAAKREAIMEEIVKLLKMSCK